MAGANTLSQHDYHPAAPDRAALSDWEAVIREEQASGKASLLGPIMAGILTLGLGVGGFFYWAASTDIAQASIASGKIVVESKTKTVTQLEGGTLKAMVVEEGQKVRVGDLLATFDVTRAQATLTQLRRTLFAAEVRLARVNAEKDGSSTFSFNGPVPASLVADAAEVIANETRLFRERTQLQTDQIAADQSSIEQLASQRVALTARRQSWVDQAEVIRRDYETFERLSQRRLATRNLVNDKKLQLVDVETRIAESDALLAENSQRKTQLELSLTNRRNDYFRTLTEQAQQANTEIANARQEIISAEYAVSRSEIRATEEGIVANIRLRTPGSALLGGQPLLDIVPDDQPMIIEGHARPADIDQIKVGDRTEIKLSAFGAAELKPLVGHITYIAPDGIQDERTGEVTFSFKARLDPAELKKQPNLFLYPGMTAEVYIINGNRTALAYLLEPVTKSFYRAFREQ